MKNDLIIALNAIEQKHDLELALMDDIRKSIEDLDLQKIVAPIKREAEKAYGLMIGSSKKYAQIESEIKKAKDLVKQLGVEDKSILEFERRIKIKGSELNNLLKGINNAKNIETNL